MRSRHDVQVLAFEMVGTARASPLARSGTCRWAGGGHCRDGGDDVGQATDERGAERGRTITADVSG